MVAAHTSSPPSPATGQRQVPDALAASESSRVCVLPSQEADLAQEHVAALAAAAGREDELESESEGEQSESFDDADHKERMARLNASLDAEYATKEAMREAFEKENPDWRTWKVAGDESEDSDDEASDEKAQEKLAAKKKKKVCGRSRRREAVATAKRAASESAAVAAALAAKTAAEAAARAAPPAVFGSAHLVRQKHQNDADRF